MPLEPDKAGTGFEEEPGRPNKNFWWMQMENMSRLHWRGKSLSGWIAISAQRYMIARGS